MKLSDILCPSSFLILEGRDSTILLDLDETLFAMYPMNQRIYEAILNQESDLSKKPGAVSGDPVDPRLFQKALANYKYKDNIGIVDQGTRRGLVVLIYRPHLQAFLDQLSKMIGTEAKEVEVFTGNDTEISKIYLGAIKDHTGFVLKPFTPRHLDKSSVVVDDDRGMAAMKMMQAGLITPKQTVQIGSKTTAAHQNNWVRTDKFTGDMNDRGLADVLSQLKVRL